MSTESWRDVVMLGLVGVGRQRLSLYSFSQLGEAGCVNNHVVSPAIGGRRY